MRAFFLLFIIALPISVYAQKSSTPTLTLKAGIGVTGNYGEDFKTIKDEKNMYYQPALSGGVVVKNFIYVGVYASKFQWYKNGLRTHERKINALELGHPIKGKHIVGITYGNVKTWYPCHGMFQLEISGESELYGVFVDYKLTKYFSVPLRISTSEDPLLSDTSTSLSEKFWHITIGITGNLPISF
ncbi:hypothetical protein ACFLU5_07965 [Bacteroidota bacterium]